MNKSLLLFKGVMLTSVVAISQLAIAYDSGNNNRAFSIFDDWEEAQYTYGALDGSPSNPDNIIGPGGGGQAFDTEYMFYKYTEGTGSNLDQLSIAIQAGFDLEDGHIIYSGRNYYAGDLALSFDNNVNHGNDSTNPDSNGYEYAIDFGLETRDRTGRTHRNTKWYKGQEITSDDKTGVSGWTEKSGDGSDGFVNLGADGNNGDGIDTQGLYRVTEWNNNISKTISSPFAMDEGNYISGLTENSSFGGYSDGNNRGNDSDTNLSTSNSNLDKSYYRIVTFDLVEALSLGETFTVDAHWIMSCGNDAINGSFNITRSNDTPPGSTPVPEPSILALFSIGSLGLGFMGYRRRKLNGAGVMIA